MKRITAVAALAVSTLVQGQNLVSNGGFETVTGGSSGHIGVNSIGLDGWTATRLSGSGNSGSTSFALVGTAADFSQGGTGVYSAYGAPGGSTKLNLWGTIPDASRGNILVVEADQSWVATQLSTTVSGLTPGNNYTLTFDWAAAQQVGFNGDTSSGWQGSIGVTPFNTGAYAIASNGFSGWQQATYTFTSSSNNALLSFIAFGTGGGLPPMALLDNVQVNPVVVPEPGEYAGAFAGLLVVAGVARKIRANQAK
jgi:hypothetical protein